MSLSYASKPPPGLTPAAPDAKKPKRFYPIAPDGHIPNSVIRKAVDFTPPPEAQMVDAWTLKPIPKQVTFEVGKEEEKTEVVDVPSSGSVKPKGKSGKGKFNKQKMRKATDKVKSKMMLTKLKVAVAGTEPTLEATPAPFIFTNEPDNQVDVDKEKTFSEDILLEDPYSDQLLQQNSQFSSGLTIPHELKKNKSGRGRRFSISKAEEDDSHPLLKKITDEQWFPRNTPKTVDNVISSFIAFMTNVDDSVNTKICDYIVEIHREKSLGFTPAQFKSLGSKLKQQLQHSNSTYRKNAIHALTELGINDNKTIMEMLPLLIDEKEEVQKEVAVALKKLAGISNKDKLLHMFKDMGVLQEESSRQDENETLASLTEALAVDENENLKELSSKVKAWLGPVSSMTIPTDEGDHSRRRRKEKQKLPGKEAESKEPDIPGLRQDGLRRKRKGPAVTTDGSMSSRTGKLLPNNPLLYKTYDHQRMRTNTPQTEVVTDDELPAMEEPEKKLPALLEKHRLQAMDDRDDKDTGIGTDRDSDTGSTFGLTSFEGTLPRAMISVPREGIRGQSPIAEQDETELEKNNADDESGEHLIVSQNVRDGTIIGQTAEDCVTPLVRSDDMFAVDSGIQSDDQSSQHGGTSLVRRGVPHLSPIKSSALVDTIDRQPSNYPENWRDFFNRPSAQNRRRIAEEKIAAAESRSAAMVLPPIRYYNKGERVQSPEIGLRLLQSVSVRDKARTEHASSDDGSVGHRAVRVHEIPSKLSVHTTSLHNGLSKFGILNLRWTTGAHGSKAELTSAPAAGVLPRLRDHRLSMSTQSVSTDGVSALPHMAGARDQGLEFVWQQPLPPAPDHGWRVGDLGSQRDHDHYCEYYRLLKKRMNDHTSLTNPQTSDTTRITVLKLTQGMVGNRNPLLASHD